MERPSSQLARHLGKCKAYAEEGDVRSDMLKAYGTDALRAGELACLCLSQKLDVDEPLKRLLEIIRKRRPERTRSEVLQRLTDRDYESTWLDQLCR